MLCRPSASWRCTTSSIARSGVDAPLAGRVLGVDLLEIDLAGVLEGRFHRALGDLVERDPVDPGRQRGVAAEGVDLPIHLVKHVLRDFFGVFLVCTIGLLVLEALIVLKTRVPYVDPA